MASEKRAIIHEHHVVTVKVEYVVKTGTIPYNGTPEEATNVQREVREIGTANITDDSLSSAIEKAIDTLNIIGK